MSENVVSPPCQYFVMRKKRLCRMTVKPGRSYCGEHEPKPVTADGQDDTRIPCPYDSKHTCYKTRLLHHLSICNARPTTPPPYVSLHVNTTDNEVVPERVPLGQLPADDVLKVVDKVHRLYQEHVEWTISTESSHPIHAAVLPEFTERGRTEASLRHLRQASSLLHVMEREGLVNDGTCYVELGAGKGQLSLFVWRAWCENKSTDDHSNETPNKPAETGNRPGTTSNRPGTTGNSTGTRTTGSGVLLVDRAALRHKRDAKMRIETPSNSERENWVRVRADLAHVALQQVPVVANRRHLVGMAKHLCGVATDYALRSLTNGKAFGGVLATCCHHRCELNNYTGRKYLQELGLSLEEQNVMLGIVSWATCGDGRARTHPDKLNNTKVPSDDSHGQGDDNQLTSRRNGQNGDTNEEEWTNKRLKRDIGSNIDDLNNTQSKINSNILENENVYSESERAVNTPHIERNIDKNEHNSQNHEHNSQNHEHNSQNLENNTRNSGNIQNPVKLSVEEREIAGRRAKALLDYGRVAYLRECGFEARLCHFVPATVSLENVAIVAKKFKDSKN